MLALRVELEKAKRDHGALVAKLGGKTPEETAAADAAKSLKKAKKEAKKESKAPKAQKPAAEKAASLAKVAAGNKAAKQASKGPAAAAVAVPAGAKTAYVGGLPYEETSESVTEYFGIKCGAVASVVMKNFDEEEGRFCGIALVTFTEEAGLSAALALDGTGYGDRTLKVRVDQNAVRRPPPTRKDGSLTIYAGNMSYDLVLADVRAHFEAAGCAIARVRFHTDPDTGNYKGFCHLEMQDEESLNKGLALADTEFHGRELRISHSETKRTGPAAPREGKKRAAGDADAPSKRQQKRQKKAEKAEKTKA